MKLQHKTCVRKYRFKKENTQTKPNQTVQSCTWFPPVLLMNEISKIHYSDWLSIHNQQLHILFISMYIFFFGQLFTDLKCVG